MKKIINGKLYDTETAETVGSRCNGYSYNDFRRLDETLYRKRTGEFFLYGEGGPMSQYAETFGDGETSGWRIVPLTLASAKIWAEKWLATDVYIKTFGAVEE